MVFQDDKVVFVRHGSVFVRVSPNRLLKVQHEMIQVTEHFWAGKLQEIQFRYIGFDIHQTPNGILLEQTNFVKDLKIPKVSIQRTAQKQEDLSSEEYTKLRSLVGRLNWVVQGS